MKAIHVQKPGGPEVLEYREIPVPEPGTGEVRIQVEAAGLNFIEIYQRSGAYKVPMPMTLGMEGAGRVDALGAGVESLAVGDRVASFNLAGSYAQFALARAERLVRIPDGVRTEEAAAVMLQGMTAHYLAKSTYPLKKGDTCLVHAAAGGVGLLLCQIAKACGARVIGTVSTKDKARLARQAGADEVILYTETDFVSETLSLTDRKGVDVVYDSVGKTTFEKGFEVLAPRGMMVLYGQSSGAVGPFDPQILNQRGSVFLTRPTLFHYTASREELAERAEAVLGWVRSGNLKVTIGEKFPLERAADAHRALEGRRTVGKVLLIP